ncbi:MAG: hypothetical protein ABI651_14935 [Verrucomicrobiota bacterium]
MNRFPVLVLLSMTFGICVVAEPEPEDSVSRPGPIASRSAPAKAEIIETIIAKGTSANPRNSEGDIVVLL